MKNIDQDQPKPNVAFIKLINDMGGNKAAIGRRLRNEDGEPVSGQLIGQYMAGRHKPKSWFFDTWKAVYGEDISHLFSETESEANVSRETVNEPAAVYEKLAQANIFLEESVRNLTETQKINALSIERLIALLEDKLSSEAQRKETASPAGPGTDVEPKAKGIDLLGNKKKSDKQ